MAKKSDGKIIGVAVVGLSGTEKEKGQIGIGKSCFCNRFIRQHADDYNVDHISVLSQSDFSGRVVNNDHFLYWGSVNKEFDDQDYQFHLVEQTEFIDDACFQPFKAGKMESYVKRCTATKLHSAEKLMYVCKNQLGIEQEYEERYMPEGKLSIDGFLCLYDVSHVPGRTWEKQNEFTASILMNIMKIKKPCILVTTKNDEASDIGIKEAERLVQRREFKGCITIVETSSHDNVNIDKAFHILTQHIDKCKNRIKVPNYSEALRLRRERLDYITESFTQLIRNHVVDHRELWSSTCKKLCHYPEWLMFVEQFGRDGTQVVFGRHIRRLKEERRANKLRRQLSRLPQILCRLQLNVNELQESDWPMVVHQLRSHRDFSLYFSEGIDTICSDIESNNTNNEGTLPVGERAKKFQTLGSQQKIPYEILESNEATTIFKTFLHEMQEERRNQDMCVEFKRLLEETGYVTPGKQLNEVRVLLMGRECYESLSDIQLQKVYDQHQRQLQRQAKKNFQELLLEHADLFYHFKNISPAGTITQEDIKEITDVLQEDSRYKMLDRMEQDRKLLLFQHLGFVHCPMREHCPAVTCLDSTLPLLLNTRVGTLTSSGQSTCGPAAPWAITPDSDTINLLVMALDNLAEEFGKGLIAACDAERKLAIDGNVLTIDYRTISDDYNNADHNYLHNDFGANGYLCVYQDRDSFEYIRECAEKTLLKSLEQDDKLPFQGLPLVIVFVQDDNMEKKEVLRLQEDGQNLADNLHCTLLEVGCGEIGDTTLCETMMSEVLKANAMKAGAVHLYREPVLTLDSDIRIMVCMFCGDPYSPERVLNPLLSHQSCLLTGERSISIHTFLGDSKRRVEIIISSFHGANQFREELIHGFVLIYSAKRKASLASLNAFSMNIPNLPIQVVAITEGGASTFFTNDIGHVLITEGNSIADNLGAHFTTYTPDDKSAAFYTAFFLEVWEKKEEIERAFSMEEPSDLPDLARPRPPPRNHSYMNNHNKMENKASDSLELLICPERRDNTEYSDIVNNKNRSFMKGFSVYPPPSTPPEPAPPDYRLHDLSHGGWTYTTARAYTTGRRSHGHTHAHQLAAHTLKQPPGKLDLNNYTMVTEALQHINIGSTTTTATQHNKKERKGKIKEGNEYTEAPSIGRHRRHRRHHEKVVHHQPPSLSETDSSGSSDAGSGSRVARRRHTHHRQYKKRSLSNLVASGNTSIQSPRVPKLGMFVGPPELPTGYNKTAKYTNEKVAVAGTAAGAGSETSDDSSEESRKTRPLPSIPHQPHKLLDQRDQPSSAPDSSSTATEGRTRRHQVWTSNKHKTKENKKNSTTAQSANNTSSVFQNVGPLGKNGVPLFVEKCIEFIEGEGLTLEGLYRVPGNRAHVDMLFKKFNEDEQVEFRTLDVPVNAVATALKDYFSKRLTLFDDNTMTQLENIAAMRSCVVPGGVELKDRSWRLLALRHLINSQLSQEQKATLDYIFAHFTRVAENSKINSMDSKNLAICWWPTLLPLEFTDMSHFEVSRPYLEDIIQTMIDQYPFLFRGQEAFVMV